MKIGLLCCFYNCAKDLKQVISPWIEAKKRYDIKIAISHGMFEEYSKFKEDYDIETLDLLLYNKWDDFLYIQNNYYYSKDKPLYENEAKIRDYSLQYLLKEKCDIIILLDGDEFYTEEQIYNIIYYINQPENQFYAWFSIPMKNYILDGNQWLDGFCPPRIFRTNTGEHQLLQFYFDNDVTYLNKQEYIKATTTLSKYNNVHQSYKELPNKQIPSNQLNDGIKHMTWLHSNGEDKVNYQLAHFGHCSYRWNNIKKELEIDYDFYSKNNLPLPIINKDE